MKNLRPKLLLLGSSLAFGCGAAEIAVRVIGDFDVDGNFTFRNRVIRPHHLPIRRVEGEVRQLRASGASILVDHPNLGWAPRPGSRSADGRYSYNSQGLRSPIPAYAARPDSGVLRPPCSATPSPMATTGRTPTRSARSSRPGSTRRGSAPRC